MRQHPPKAPLVRTANERWKDRRRLRLACSGVAALLLHASVLVVWPSAKMESPGTDAPPSSMELLQVARTAVDRSGSSPEPVPTPAAPVVEEGGPADDEGEDASEGRDGRSDTRVAGSSESLFERIRNRAPAPELTERVPEPDARTRDEESSSRDDELAAGNERPTTADVPDMLDLSDLELERLSEVRPQLVLTAPSGWVTVKNQSDVRKFMRRMYRRGVMDPDASGSVSVALWIDEEGSVEWAEVTDSSGREEMDSVALDLFRDVVTFRPAREEGAPVATSAVFSVVFPWPEP